MRRHKQKLFVVLSMVSCLELTGCQYRYKSDTYYLVATNLKIPYWKAVQEGFNDAAKEYTVSAYVVGPDAYDPAQEADAFSKAVARHPAGILVSVADAGALRDGINSAVSAGIPVITVDSDAPLSSRLYVRPTPQTSWPYSLDSWTPAALLLRRTTSACIRRPPSKRLRVNARVPPRVVGRRLGCSINNARRRRELARGIGIHLRGSSMYDLTAAPAPEQFKHTGQGGRVMSEGYVKRLLNPSETLNVLRELPIVTGDFRKDRMEQNVRNLQSYESVKKLDRVCFFDLRIDNFNGRNLKLHLEDTSTSATLTSGFRDKAKKLRPCFYLPYRKYGTTRMKLLPDPTYNGDTPRFFATATIDGCSVYVEGPADTPKVSHLNASNVAPPPENPNNETEVVRQQRVQQKIVNMDARMNAIKKAQTHVVERQHYIEDFNVGRTAMRQTFANRKGLALNLVTDYQPFGAVIGVKNGNNWKFYLQKCGRFEYHTVIDPKTKIENAVISANEFWPTNVGGVRIF